MKVIKKLLSSSGLSLTEMMVGVGIMGGLSLVVMNLAEQGVKSGNQINKEAEITEFQNLVVKSFENPQLCSTALSENGAEINNISGTNQKVLNGIYSNSNTVTNQYLYVYGNVSASTRNGVNLTKAYVEKYNPNLKTADLVTVYEYKLDGQQKNPNVKIRRLTLGINLDSSNTNISSCSVKSTGVDLMGPKVDVEQDSTQVDPAQALPIKFVIGFDEAIDPTTFNPADITNSGTATGVTWSLSSTDNTTWYLQAIAVTNPGTIVPVLAKNVVKDRAGNSNELSTSVDNIVTYTPPQLVWLSGAPYPPQPDNFGNAVCNTSHFYTLKNIGTTTSGTIETSLGSTANFNIGVDNCNTKTLAGGATCTVEVKFLASTISAGTFATDLRASVNGGVPVLFNLTGTKVMTDPCATSPSPGTVCSGCKSIFLGSSGVMYYLSHLSGCNDSATPTCLGATDTLAKMWAPQTNLVLEGASSFSDGESNTNILAAKSYTYGAKFCADMVYDGQSDWFLPAREEMPLLYQVRDLVGGVNFSQGYLTSTEMDSGNFYGYSMGGGYAYGNYKYYHTSYFRCMRKFDSTDPCQALTEPSAGTTCLGGAKYLGTLTVGGNIRRYMTTPGGCTDVPADANRGGTSSSTYYYSIDFTPTCSGSTDTVRKQWSNGSAYDIPGVPTNNPSDANTSGQDTTPIIAAITSTTQGGYHPAARYCDKLVYGGYSDWFLPSRVELQLLYSQIITVGGTVGAGTNYYQSSIETSASNQYVLQFPTGTIYNGGKTSSHFVRCMRRF